MLRAAAGFAHGQGHPGALRRPSWRWEGWGGKQPWGARVQSVVVLLPVVIAGTWQQRHLNSARPGHGH